MSDLRSENFKSKAESWNERSSMGGVSLKTVLFKSFPLVLNEHLHRWHTQFVLQALKEEKNKSCKILDVGCGYGRMTSEILRVREECQVIGVDISKVFVEMYKKATQQEAYCLSVEELGESFQDFDIVLCVTVLMYTEGDHFLSSFEALMKSLRPGGRLLLVEPTHSGKLFQGGFSFMELFNVFSKDKSYQTGGRFFSSREIKEVVEVHQGAIVRSQNMPFTTVFIIPLFLLCKVLPIMVAKPLLNICELLDSSFSFIAWPTLYRAYVIEQRP